MPHFGPNRSFPATRSCCTRTEGSRMVVSITLRPQRKEMSRRHNQAKNPRPSAKETIRLASEPGKVSSLAVGMRRALMRVSSPHRSGFRANQRQSVDLERVDACAGRHVQFASRHCRIAADSNPGQLGPGCLRQGSLGRLWRGKGSTAGRAEAFRLDATVLLPGQKPGAAFVVRASDGIPRPTGFESCIDVVDLSRLTCRRRNRQVDETSLARVP